MLKLSAHTAAFYSSKMPFKDEDARRQWRINTGRTKRSYANKQLVSQVNKHVSETAEKQTQDIICHTTEALRVELDKRFNPVLLEQPEDSEKCKSMITRAKKCIAQVDVQRNKDTLARKRKETKVERRPRKRARNGVDVSSTGSTTATGALAGAPPQDTEVASPATTVLESDSEAEVALQAQEAEVALPAQEAEVALPAQEEEVALPAQEAEVASPVNNGVIVKRLSDDEYNTFMDGLRVEEVRRDDLEETSYKKARDLHPDECALEDDDFTAFWLLQIAFEMKKNQQDKMDFFDALHQAMIDVGTHDLPSWIFQRHSPSVEHWAEWLSRVSEAIELNGFNAIRTILSTYNMYLPPSRETLNENERFALRLIDFATLVQMKLGDCARTAVLKAEREYGGSLYSFWPGIGIDLTAASWQGYIEWLFDVKKAVEQAGSLNSIETVLYSKSFFLPP